MVKNFVSRLFILTLIIVIGMAVTDKPSPWALDSLWRHPYVRIPVAFAALGLLVYFVFFNSGVKSPEKTALGKPRPVPPTAKEISEAQEAVKAYDKETLALFVKMLANLPDYLIRINENIEALEETSQLQITKRHVYRTGPNPPKTLLVPIARLEKGTLLDGFDVRDSAGKSLPTLSYTRLRGLVALALDMLVDIAIQSSNLGESVVQQRQEATRKSISQIVVAMCGPPRQVKTEDFVQREDLSEGDEKIRSAIQAIGDLPINATWKERVEGFCTQYVDSYVIVAEVGQVEVESHLILSYSHKVSSNVTPDKKEARRRIFGLKPATVDIALNPFAFYVEAYHQQVTATPGQYVYDHHLEWLETDNPVDQDTFQVSPGLVAGTLRPRPYVRVYYDDARPNAHLYIRRQAEEATPSSPPSVVANGGADATSAGDEEAPRRESADAMRDPRPPSFQGRIKSVVEFRETPPGTLGAATLIALASAAIISFFAITHTGLDIDPAAQGAQAENEQIKATLNSDVPALLLALPAFIGVLIGSWLELARLRRASLTTYLALTTTMLLSVASALVFVYDVNRKLPTALDVSVYGKTEPLKTDWIWLGLMAIAVTHLLFLVRALFSESRHYSKRAERRLAEIN